MSKKLNNEIDKNIFTPKPQTVKIWTNHVNEKNMKSEYIRAINLSEVINDDDEAGGDPNDECLWEEPGRCRDEGDIIVIRVIDHAGNMGRGDTMDEFRTHLGVPRVLDTVIYDRDKFNGNCNIWSFLCSWIIY